MSHYLIVEAGEDPTAHRFDVDKYGVAHSDGTVTVYRPSRGPVLILADGYWSKVELVEHDAAPHLGPDLNAVKEDLRMSGPEAEMYGIELDAEDDK